MKINKIILSLVFFILISTAAWAASPVIFYSDLTAGPKTGGQNNNGVFVTIWGNNFGSTQGSSYITLGGGQVNNYPTWTNTMICFQLGANTATGNIVLVTSNGNATGPAFTVQASNIYFVQPGASTNGSGTYTSPFNHMYYAEQIVNPGDTVYVEAGTIYDEVDGYQGWHTLLMPITSGTQASPISWVAYPGATVTLKADGAADTWSDDGGADGDTVQYIFRGNNATWQTFSKFYLVFTGNTNLENVADSDGEDGWKFVGNNSTATYYAYCQFCISGAHGQALGNEIHDSGSLVTNGNELHSIYVEAGANPFEVGWNYMHGNENTGWEISNYHNGPRIGTIHDNLIIAGSSGSVKGILADGCGDTPSPDTLSTMETNVAEVYNNVIVNAGQNSAGGALQANCGTNYIYNNTIYGSGTETDGVIQFENGGIGPGGGNPVEYVANNIIYANNSGLYLSDATGVAPIWTNFALLTNNNYYGAGNGPTQDAKAINANPQFISPSTSVGGNFQLQSTSPDINAGYNVISIVVNDLLGLLRSTTPTIGAYQYSGSSSVLPSSPVVAITSPASGSSYTAGSNVAITTTASETNGTIANISLYSGSGLLLGSSNTSPYTFVDTNMAAGGYSFYAVAKDTNGVSTTSSTITITITSSTSTSTAPVVAITSPANGSTYQQSSTFTITSSASETNGSITQVQYYTGSYLLATATTSPYTASWTNATTGTFTINAKAIDVNGVSTMSSPITFTVITASSTVAPSISAQPVSMTVTAPATATFSVTAAGAPTPTFQWMQSVNGGAFTNISGATNSSYTTAATTVANNGTQYKCVVTNTAGSVTSNTAILTVNSTGQSASGTTIPPASQIIDSKGTVWTVAHGNSFQNGVADGGGGSSGDITLMLYYNGIMYVNTTNDGWWEWTSGWGRASGDPRGTIVAPSITTQPASITVTAPATATFTVAANGSPVPTYQWMQSIEGGAFTNINGATASSYTTPATTATNNGTQFECVVSNSSGSVTSNAVSLTVNQPSNTGTTSSKPVITITSPTNGSSFKASSNITMTANASETNGTITGVYFYNGTTYLGSDSSSPYSYTWTNVPAGSYNLIAVAIDASGVSVTSNAVTVTVTAPATAQAVPVVSISSPSNGSSFTQGSTFTITSSASETNGTIAQVQYYSGSTLLATATKSPYTATWTNATTGTFTVTAKATDANGVSTTSSPITITVTAAVQTPSTPIVSITSPTSGTKVITGSTITINVSASETNGTISQVRFYNGTTLLYTVYSSPYSYSWAVQLLPGTYNISAQATDNNGVTATSSTVPITVAL